jgi:hypothetical protein
MNSLKPLIQSFIVRILLLWQVAWPILRQALGWFCILLGLIGLVLPVLQGVIFLVIGISLVGRRNIVLRWASVGFKRFLRSWAASPYPILAVPGRWALHGQHQLSRQRRRLYWWRVERRRLIQQKLLDTHEHDSP